MSSDYTFRVNRNVQQILPANCFFQCQWIFLVAIFSSTRIEMNIFSINSRSTHSSCSSVLNVSIDFMKQRSRVNIIESNLRCVVINCVERWVLPVCLHPAGDEEESLDGGTFARDEKWAVSSPREVQYEHKADIPTPTSLNRFHVFFFLLIILPFFWRTLRFFVIYKWSELEVSTAKSLYSVWLQNETKLDETGVETSTGSEVSNFQGNRGKRKLLSVNSLLVEENFYLR